MRADDRHHQHFSGNVERSALGHRFRAGLEEQPQLSGHGKRTRRQCTECGECPRLPNRTSALHSRIQMPAATQPHLSTLTPCSQVNFLPNDGECVRPSTFPANEFSTSVLGGKPVSWRFFLNKNSAACKVGTTTTAMIPNGKVQGGVSIELPFSHLHPALAPL